MEENYNENEEEDEQIMLDIVGWRSDRESGEVENNEEGDLEEFVTSKQLQNIYP